MSTTLNNYADVQKLLNDFVDNNSFNIGGSPHGKFWNTLTYDQFISTTPHDIFSPYPASVLVVVGDASSSPLIQVLTGGNGGTNTSIYPDMPQPSPPGYDANTPSQTDVISSLTDWINADCPNNGAAY